jgi:hypothetical protein
MSLQARLRHPLGERWIELPERGVDHPLVVGRAGTADLQVPSVTVAQKHCVLFVHEGRWVVQHVAGGAPGTFVNGSPIEGAAFLHVGDVISLGADATAPKIEIDPAGVARGRGGQPAEAILPAAAIPPSAADPPPAYGPPAPYMPPQPPAPVGYPASYPVYPGGYPVPTHPAQPAPVPEGTIAEWPADATPRYYTPRRRRPSDGSSGVIIGMFLTLLITAGAGYWIYRSRQQSTPSVMAPSPATQGGVTPPRTRVEGDPSTAPPNIFDTVRPPATARATTRVTAPAPSAGTGSTLPADPPMAAGPPGSTEQPLGSEPGPTSEDPVATAAVTADDPEWKQVEQAVHLKDEAKAILQFDDFGRIHPGTNSDKLQAFTDRMVDRIWFERIENLCDQREDLNKKIQEADKDLSEETDEAYKKRVLVPLRQQYLNRLQNIEEELTQNMKYTAKATPNLLDDAEIDKLRQGRDPQYYESWKSRVLAHIRRTHGELPWVATKSR